MTKVSGHNNERYSGKRCSGVARDRVGGGGGVCELIYLSVGYNYFMMEWIFTHFY